MQRQGRAEVALNSGGPRIAEAQGLTQAFAGRTLLKDLTWKYCAVIALASWATTASGNHALADSPRGSLPEGGVVRRGTQLSIGYLIDSGGLRWISPLPSMS